MTLLGVSLINAASSGLDKIVRVIVCSSVGSRLCACGDDELERTEGVGIVVKLRENVKALSVIWIRDASTGWQRWGLETFNWSLRAFCQRAAQSERGGVGWQLGFDPRSGVMGWRF